MRDAAILGGEVYLLKSEGIMIILLCISLWLIIGVGSFIYWWTRDFDYTTNEILITIVGAFMGVFSFFIGWAIHGNRSPRVLFKKRK